MSALKVARIVLVLTFLILASAPRGASATQTFSPRCIFANRVPVALADGAPASEKVWAQLCEPRSGRAQVVQVLISGLTLGNTYWDFPYQPKRYSYVRALTAGGIATLNYDRVGVGRSSHPLSTLIDLDTQTFVVHQLVQKLRAGAFGPKFRHVVLVGHSMGTPIAEIESTRYNDVDALILSSWSHTGSDPNVFPIAFAQDFWPALLDPRFSGSGLDPGYLTTRPGHRASLIAPGDTDSKVIAIDERTKETATATEIATLFSVGDNEQTGPYAVATGVTVPVLLAVGGADGNVCNAGGGSNCADAKTFRAAETSYYPEERSLDAFVLPRAGHFMNYELNAPAWFRAALAWTRRVVG